MPNSAFGLPSRANSALERAAQRRLSSIETRASFSVVMWPTFLAPCQYGVHSSNCMTMSLLSTVWICMLTSGVRNSLSPLTGEANLTPSSLILRISPRLQTWKPPLSVRIGRVQFSKRCRPPNCAITSCPGRIQRWKVLPRMICAPMVSRSRGITPLTVP